MAKALLPEYLSKLANLQSELAEVEALAKTAVLSDEDEDSEQDEDIPTPTELKQLKTQLAAIKKTLRAEKAAFATRLTEAGEALDESAARRVVLDALQRDLLTEAQIRIGRHRTAVIASCEGWWDKYRTPLSQIESERDAASVDLARLLTEHGYE